MTAFDVTSAGTHTHAYRDTETETHRQTQSHRYRDAHITQKHTQIEIDTN